MTTLMCRCLARHCAHFRGFVGPTDLAVAVCLAYPTGIPQVILTGLDAHLAPRPDDAGYVYQSSQATPSQEEMTQ